MVAGKTRQDLDIDRKMNLALVRLLEVVGEAASRVPVDERSQYPQIPWSQIVALRNRLNTATIPSISTSSGRS